MSTELDKLRQTMMTAARQNAIDAPLPRVGKNSMFTFRYSCTEISAHGGQLNVKMKETRFEDGKLTSEECEGTLDRGAYDAAVREAQQQFLNQCGNFIRQFFLPFSGR